MYQEYQDNQNKADIIQMNSAYLKYKEGCKSCGGQNGIPLTNILITSLSWDSLPR